jgi:hypothetical protein
MHRNIPRSRLTSRQVMMVLAVRAAQKSVKGITFGKFKPHWSLTLATRYAIQNRELDTSLENSENCDIEPDPLSLVYC